MTCKLQDPTVAATIEREHAAAKQQAEERRAAREANPEAVDPVPPTRRDFRTSELHKIGYLAIGPKQGAFLYGTARAIKAKNIVEFGTSHGISTLYLAAAAADNGGRVTGSEFHASKAEKARQNLSDAGLGDLVDIRVGDAQETLKGVDGDIDLLFLDGAKDMYVPILKMLEDRLRPGSIVIADNVEHGAEETAEFSRYMRDNPRFVSSMFRFKKSRFSYSVVMA